MKRPYTLVFYDGHCGLCHRSVLFALRRDVDGSRFRFAPLQGPTFASEVALLDDFDASDSIVVLGEDGSLHQQSDAVILILEKIGGIWRHLGRVLATLPQRPRDGVYRGIAKLRKWIFRQPPGLCPLVPSTLNERFLP